MNKPTFKELYYLCVQKLTNFPYIEEDFDALTNYELLCKVVEELNKMITNMNTQNESIIALYNAFNTLKTYIDNYFENLDVQEEINNKLDEMASSGELTNLIKGYVDPIYQAYEEEINEDISSFKSQTNNSINELRNEVESIASGSPIPVSSTSDMTDTTKLYLLLSDNYVYYYNGSTWVQGWVYQATIQEYDTTLTLNNTVPNSKSVGDKINNNVLLNNYFDKNNFTNNKYISSNMTIGDNNSRFITNMIKVNQGDNLFSNCYTPTSLRAPTILTVAKVNELGIIQSMKSGINQARWTADEDCYVKLSIDKGTLEDSDIINYFCVSKNYVNYSYKNYEYHLKENENDMLEYDNYVDPNKILLGCTYNSQLNALSSSTNFITNIIKCNVGDVFRMYYFNNDNSIRFNHIVLLDENMHNISRVINENKTYTCNHTGYIIPVGHNPNGKTDLDEYLVITKNKEISNYIPYQAKIKQNYLRETNINNDNVSISKIDNSNFLINYGKFNVKLFKTINESINANNWNLGTITDLSNNIIVPTNTDIIGPIKLRDENDFIGGVHGNEITDYIYVSIDGNSYPIENVTNLSGHSLNIIMISSIYNRTNGNKVANRNVNIRIENNKININNSYTFITDVSLHVACTGGLIACRNNIIKNIMFNNSYFDTPPTSNVNNLSSSNTNAIINTLYGSITLNNIKGHELNSYAGWLTTFSNESPIRNKIYFTPYYYGTYNFTSGKTISGEFEYLFS